MPKNMQKMLKQAQKMQSKMMAAQEELQKKEFEGDAGGGMVKVTINGSNEMLSVKLNPEVVDPDDVEMLEDLIVAAVANAQGKVKEQTEAAFGNVTGGMQIPGMM